MLGRRRIAVVLVLAAVQGASCGGLAASLGFVARAAPTWGSDARRTGCLRPAAAHAEGSPTSGANAWRTGRVRSAVVLLRAASPNDSVPPKRSFVSRKLTDVLPDPPAPSAEPSSPMLTGKDSKRSKLRRAVSTVATVIASAPRSLTTRLFGSPEPPPLMGNEAGSYSDGVEALSAYSPVPARETTVATTETLARAVQAENERVLELVNKYSQRHSNGTESIDASDRKPLQKSKYANLYGEQEEPRGMQRSETGKLLQRSKYADVWSMQDEIAKPGRAASTKPEAAGPMRRGTGLSTRPVPAKAPGLAQKPATKKPRAEQQEPASRLEQLMTSYSNRYSNPNRPSNSVSPETAAGRGLRGSSSGTGTQNLPEEQPAASESAEPEGDDTSAQTNAKDPRGGRGGTYLSATKEQLAWPQAAVHRTIYRTIELTRAPWPGPASRSMMSLWHGPMTRGFLSVFGVMLSLICVSLNTVL